MLKLTWNQGSVVDDPHDFWIISFVGLLFITSKQVIWEILNALFQIISPLVGNALVSSDFNCSPGSWINRSWVVQWLQLLQINLESFVSWEDKVGKFLWIQTIFVIFGTFSALKQNLSFVKWNSDSNLASLLVNIVGIQEALLTSIAIIEYGLSVGSGSIPPPECLSGIMNSVQVDFIFQSVCFLFDIPRLDPIEQLLLNGWINSCLSAFVTIVHGLYLSLPGMECQCCNVLVGITCVHLVGPLLVFELSSSGSANSNWSFTCLGFLLVCVLVELLSGFISGIPCFFVSILWIQPSSRQSNLLFEGSTWWCSFILRFTHSTKVCEFLIWYIMVNFVQFTFGSEIKVGPTRLMHSFTSDIHF